MTVTSPKRRSIWTLALPLGRWLVQWLPRGMAGRMMESFDRRFWVLPAREFRRALGAGLEISGNTGDIVGFRLYFLGNCQPHLTAWIQARLQPGDTFVDVGAHIGVHTLFAAAAVGPHGRVIAIEPSPQSYGRLRENVAQNGLHQVRSVLAAVADDWRTVALYRGPDWHVGLSTVVEAVAVRTNMAGYADTVLAAPLSAILTLEEAMEVRMVKVEVEGGEELVLRGMERLLRYGREDLEVVMDLAPRRGGTEDPSVGEIVARFAALGFHPYVLAEDDMAPSSGPEGARPVRLRGPLPGRRHVVFSRRDAERL